MSLPRLVVERVGEIFENNPNNAGYFHVAQGDVQCMIFTADQEEKQKLLCTGGMNPCTGIIMCGEARVAAAPDASNEGDEADEADDEYETKDVQFIALYHNQGPSNMEAASRPNPEEIKKYCRIK